MSSDCHPFRSAAARDRYLAHYDEWERTWPVEWSARVVPTSYGDTYVRISGSSDLPPLVLLPGGRAPSLCWDAMIADLSARFCTYAVDAIYDVGKSVNSRTITTPSDVAAWFDEFLDGLGLHADANLMGLSLGGWAVAEYAHRAPQRLAKIVWLSPAAVTAPIPPAFVRHSLTCVIPVTPAFRSFLRWIMPYVANAEDPQPFEHLVHDLVTSSQCFKMRPFPGGPRELTDAELESIQVPVLYIVGDQDRACPDVAAAVSRARALVPRIQTEVFPDAGHDVSMMHLEAVTSSVLGFLQT